MREPLKRERGEGPIEGLWQEWRSLKNMHPSCATINKDLAFQDQPGLGAAVERYRKICASLR
jgi:hypothetical protein